MVETGNTGAPFERGGALGGLVGKVVRLRARDRAGNEAVAELPYDTEHILVSAVQIGHGNIASVALPDQPGGARSFVYQPGPIHIFLRHGVAARLTSFEVATVSTTVPVQALDPAQVSSDLADVELLWDSSLNPDPGPTAVVRAFDEKGRVFEDVIRLFKPQAVDALQMTACLSDAFKVNATVAARFADPTVGFDAGAAAIEFWKRSGTDSHPELSVPLPAFGGNLAADIDISALSSCEYQLRFNGRDNKGAAASQSPVDLDVCSLGFASHSVNGTELSVSLAESFRQPVRGAEVYRRVPGGTWIPAASFGSFHRQSAVAFSTLPPAAACTRQELRVVGHLADGTSFDSTVGDPRHPTCGGMPHADSVDVSCMQVRVAKPLRGTAAPFCTARDAVWTARIEASSTTPVVSTSAHAQTLNGGPPVGLSTSGTTPGTVTSTVATFATAGAAEGRYLIEADAVDQAGVTGSGMLDAASAIVVDHTPPLVSIAAPAAHAIVCAPPVQGKNAVTVRQFDVSGAVSDANLEAYTVLLRPQGGSYVPQGGVAFTAPKAASVSGVLASVDADNLPSGDYEITVDARDVSGGSVCAPPLPIHLDKDIHLTAAKASAAIFSPDGDGTLDVDDLAFTLDEAGEVHITAEPLTGGPALDLQQHGYTAGAQSFRWVGAGAPDGAYTLRLRATDACGNQSEATLPVRVDTAAPLVRIDAPADGAPVGAVLDVRGEVNDDNLDAYEISVGAGAAPQTFTVLAHSTVPVAGGELGAFTTAGLVPGPYTLRIVAADLAGHRTETRGHFVVAPGQLIASLGISPVAISPAPGRSLAVALALLQPATVQVALVDTLGAVVALAASGVALPAGASSLTVDATVLSAVTDGTYAVRAVASAPGANDSASTPLAVDRVAPQLSMALPVALSYVRGATPVVATISDPGLASWSLVLRGPDGKLSSIATGAGARSGPVASLQSLADGDHHLLLHATDAAGNSSDLDVPFTSDLTPPSIAFLSPLDGDGVSGLSAPVTVRAAVADAHLKSVRLSGISGGQERVLFDGASFAAASWDAAGTPDGPVTLQLRAEDLAGNVTVSAIAVTVDSTPPVVHLTAPRDGFASAPLRFTGTVADANLLSWTLSLGRGPDTVSTLFVPVASGKTGVADAELVNLGHLPGDGVYTARLEAEDRFGNHASDVAAFVVDTTPPAAPTGLFAASIGHDVHLSWTANAESDLAGYRILRAGANGTLAALPIALVIGTSFTDSARPDGVARYALVAVDNAGNASAPSAEARVEVDATPPEVAIQTPAAGAAVSGMVRVIGTARKGRAFAGWQLSIGDGPSPAATSLLAQSPLAVSAALLATVDTRAFAQGSVHALVLAADDGKGNRAEARATFSVDNVAPGAPALLSAAPSGNAVVLLWQPPPDADVAGTLVYRNGAIANAPPGTGIRTLTPYLLPPGTTSFTDPDVPDGTFTYAVQAMDAAGNLGSLSNSIDVDLERRAPAARMGTPQPLARIQGLTRVVAVVDDLDVAQVQIEVRAGTTSFQPLGPVLTQYPYVADLDPSTLTSPVIELRAVATDLHGNVTSDPAVSAVFFDPPLAAPLVSTSVNAEIITARWTDADPASRMAGFGVQRDGRRPVPAPATPSGVTAASSGVAQLAFDGDPQTKWEAAAPGAASWSVVFDAPAPVDQLLAHLGAAGTFDALLRIRGVWVYAGRALKGATNTTLTIPLGGALLIEGVELDFAASAAPASLAELVVTPSAVVASSPLALNPSDLGTHEIAVRAMSSFGSFSPVGTAHATIFAPALVQPDPQNVEETSFTLSGTQAGAGATVTLFDRFDAAIATALADVAGSFSAVVPLSQGNNTFWAQSTLPSGDVSLRSGVIAMWSSPLPAVQLVVSATASGADVSLAFAVSGDTSLLHWLGLLRGPHGQPGDMVAFLDGTTRSYLDPGVPNGTWDYTLVAFNNAALPPGVPSPPATVTISAPVPDAPAALAVTAPVTGSELDLAFTYGGAVPAAYFGIQRDDGSGFVDSSFAATPVYADLSVQNGRAYSYRVRAFDAAGNSGPFSNVAVGTPRRTTPVSPPQIDYPATPAAPGLAASADIVIAGRAEPGSSVEVLRAGSSLGKVAASSAQAMRDLPTTAKISRDFAVSSDGTRVAYTTSQSFVGAVVIERLGGATLVVAQQAGVTFESVSFSPDGDRVAAVGRDPSSLEHIYVVEVEGGAIRPLAPGGTRRQVQPAWSRDAASLAYLTDSAGRPALALADVATGTERVIATSTGGGFDQPSFFGASALVVLEQQAQAQAQAVVSFDVASGSRSQLYRAPSIFNLAASPRGDRLAVAADQILLLDASGSTMQVTGPTSPPWMLSFSDDGSELALQGNGEVGIVAVGTAMATVAPDSNGTSRVFVSAPGRVVAFSGSPSVQDFDGFFSLPVLLEPGDNVFTAVATTPSGASVPSQPVLVHLDAARLPDLAAEVQVVPAVPLARGTAEVAVRVSNLGGVESSAADVQVQIVTSGGVRTLPMLRVEPIAPGAFSSIVAAIYLTDLAGKATLVAVIDPAAVEPDADRSNNRAQLDFTIATTQDPLLSVALDPAQVSANGTVNATVQVLNPGAARALTVSVALQDSAGVVVSAAADQSFVTLAAGAQVSFSRSFSIGGTAAGSYQVVASAGGVRAAAPLTVAADLSATLFLETSHLSFLTGETIEVDARIANASANAALSGARYVLAVRDLAGAVVFAPAPLPLPTLARGATVTAPALIAPPGLPPGAYLASATLDLGGAALATASVAVNVIGRPLIQGGIAIENGRGSPAAIPSGADVVAAIQVENSGSAISDGVLVHFALVDPETSAVLRSQDETVAHLAPGELFTQTLRLASTGLALKTYAAVLSVDHDGSVAPDALATLPLRIADSTAPVLVLQNLAAGIYLQALARPLVRILDDFSGVAGASVAVDGAPALPLQLLSGSALDGIWSSTLLLAPDGPHTLAFFATDLEGNAGTPVNVTIVSDSVAPQVAISGVLDGALVAQAVTPIVSASDANLAAVTVTVNGVGFASGSTLADDGDYEMIAQAVDRAANRGTAVVRFSIDRTPPAISILGVQDGQVSGVPVTPVVAVADAHPGTTAITLDGVPFITGLPVAIEGAHVLEVDARDAAGNASQQVVHFTLSFAPPQVTVSGVSDGTYYATSVTPSFSSSSTDLVSLQATLNQAPFASGTVVAAEGAYALVVTAVNQAGRSASVRVAFIIEKTPPVISMSGVTDGQVTRGPVTPAFSATGDVYGLTATLNAAPFTSGSVVSAAGDYTLVVTAGDHAGNQATRTLTFSIDQTPPMISVIGVTEGALSNAQFVPTYSATDAHPASVSAQLNGTAFVSGSAVTTEGPYTLVVSAADLAGNTAQATVHFSIDKTAPAITISGVTDRGFFNSPVTPTFSAVDPHLASVTATLDGSPFVSGAVVATEGGHTLVVTASDAANNHASQTLYFTIDRTAPAITVLANGTPLLPGTTRYFNPSVTLSYSATDLNPGSVTAKLGIIPFTSGGTVSGEGARTLVVSAQDLAGNPSSASFSFVIDTTPPVISVSGIADGAFTNAASVTITYSASDLNPGSVSATLKGLPFASGGSVTAEGYYSLVVSATDLAGNSAPPLTVNFTIDRTPPVVTLTAATNTGAAVVGGAVVSAASVVVSFSSTDLNLRTVTAKLDGSPFVSGASVSSEGLHTATVSATDLAGNPAPPKTLSFIIDRTAPIISVLANGTPLLPGTTRYFKQSVTLSYSASDLNPGSVTAKLGIIPFTSGGTVSGEGACTLVVSAQDLAGNPSSASFSFVIDTTPPVISVSGIADGTFTNAASVTTTYSASDLYPGSVTATLNGLPFASGGSVSAEGYYALVVSATDLAGNPATRSVNFTIDRTPPAVILTATTAAGAPVANGAVVRASSVTVSFSSTDLNPGTVTATLDGSPFVSGASVSSESTHTATVIATDRAGNPAPKTLSFTIDRTAPVITVLANGTPLLPGTTRYFKQSVTLSYSASDLNLASVTGTLDGAPFTSGGTVSSAGPHTLVVAAADLAGASASVAPSFVIDLTPPVISVAGVADGAVTNAASVTITYSATDANPGSLSATLDGAAFASGGVVTAEGAHALLVSAMDLAGNPATRAVNFTIDRTPPAVTLTATTNAAAPVADKAVVSASSVAVSFSSTDLHPGTVTATLDGSPFVSGASVTSEGGHTATVTATDQAGNPTPKTLSFTIDRTAPVITVLANGAPLLPGTTRYFKQSVTLSYSASDLNLASVTAKLDTVSFASGGTVAAEGAHALVVSAQDLAGNPASASLSFVIDTIPPVISVSGIADGAFTNAASVTITYAATDLNPGTVTATLNGLAFASGASVTAEGAYALVVSVTDLAGNPATRAVSFTIDRTPPVIVAGPGAVTDGAYLKTTSVNLNFTETDTNSGPVTFTIDGSTSPGGTVTVAEGKHTLVVLATDRATNTTPRTIHFTVDTTPPAVTLTAVTSTGTAVFTGFVVNAASVSVSYASTDLNPGTVTATLDGPAFASGASVATEATHTALVTATDLAGNSTTRTLSFSIDRTAPTITVTGVTNGTTYTSPVTPVVTFADAHLTTTTLQLDGQPFTSGTTVTAYGAHSLVATASDAAGNNASSTTAFTIAANAYQVAKSGASGGLKLALIKAGECALASTEVTRVSSFLNQYLDPPPGNIQPQAAGTPGGRQPTLKIDSDETTFLTDLRSGLYASLVWVDLTTTGTTCLEDKDATCSAAVCATRKSIMREMTELTYSGKVGAVLVRNRAEQLPGLDELLGADVNAATTGTTVTFPASGPLGGLSNLTVVAPQFSLKLLTATSDATYLGGSLVAGGMRTLLQGKAASFGFDLTKATPASNAGQTLFAAVKATVPGAFALKPLAVALVSIGVTNPGALQPVEVDETLPSAVKFIAPTGSLGNTLCANPSAGSWYEELGNLTAVINNGTPSDTFAYFARVPDQAGTFTVTSAVHMAAACPNDPSSAGHVAGPAQLVNLGLNVAESGAGLQADASAAAAALPSTGANGTVRTNIQAKLSSVNARHVAVKADAELNLTDLLAAVDLAKSLTVDPTAMRLALDELIRYWEARWSML